MSFAEPDNDFSILLNQNNWLNGRSEVPLPAEVILLSIHPLNVTKALRSSPENKSSVRTELVNDILWRRRQFAQECSTTTNSALKKISGSYGECYSQPLWLSFEAHRFNVSENKTAAD